MTFFVKETINIAPSSATTQQKLVSRQNFLSSIKGLGKEYWITLSILTIFTFANSSDAFLLLRASDVGLSVLQVVLIYAIYNLSYSLFSYSAGKLSDRHGRWQIIALGWAVYAITYAGIAITNGYFIWILFAFYGIYMALTEGVSKALIIDCVPKEKKGTALGFLYMALGLSALSSNIIAGYLWDTFGKTTPFWAGSFSSIVAIILVFLSGRLKINFLKSQKN